ncbi:MAG: hemerythrin domain-containing protein [Pyrinomonadaceae bacterium]
MEQQLNLFHREEHLNYGLMFDIVYNMTHYPDWAHHLKRDIAFELVVERKAASIGLMEDLNRQHDVITQSGKALHEQPDAAMIGVMLPRTQVEQPVWRYVEYFHRHMHSEEGVLFPLAKRALDDKDRVIIGTQPPAATDPLFGDHVSGRDRSL